MKHPNRLSHSAMLSHNAGLFSFFNKITGKQIPTFKKLFFTLSFFICIIANSQTTIGRQKVDQYKISSYGTLTYGLTWLPTDYNSTTTKYPLIIFLHGTGEAGSGIGGLNNLIGTGLPQIIANGFNVEATNPNDGLNYKFIVVSPQAPQWSYTYTHMVSILADVMTKYRVDPSMVYITGLSAGGAGTWSSLLNDDNFTQKFAAALPVDAVDANDPAEEVNLPYISSRNGVKLWSICGQLDAWLATAYRYQGIINNSSPVTPMAVTEIPGAGHSAASWNTAYNPSWRSNAFNLNVFEWMLKNKRGGSTPVPNQPPIDNAGLDKTITLPTNSVSVTGSASDADGTIASYSWSKISGPSQYTIASPSSASTSLTGLVQGIYLFRLTVTDNKGATAADDVQVTVNPAGNTPPVANAGPDKTITLPTNSVSLAGSGTDANGTVASYSWSKISGPTQYAFSNSNIANPVLSNLVAGTYTLRLTISDNQGASATDDINIVVNALSPGKNIPGRIEAESYNTMLGVQTEGTDDTGGGLDVGWIDQNDWMDYNVNVTTAGTYTVNFRYATPSTGAEFQLRKSDGTALLTQSLPSTGSFQTWQTVSTTVTLAAGAQTLRVYSSAAANWNFNWIDFIASSTPPPPPTSTQPIPGKIQAESYATMFGIQTEATGDGGPGLNVGYIDQGDWMDYSVNVATTGTYTVNFRIATPNTGASFQIKKADGTVLLTQSLSSTGAYQTWQTLSATISLTAGAQTLRIYSTSVARWNINWLEFVASGTPPPPSSTQPIPGKIEVESYNTMLGVQKENTDDAGRGLDVGWIDQGDWMDYNVNVTTAGTYAVNFRIATPNTGAAVQIRKADGTVLLTTNLPATGDWQTWQTVSGTITLAAGAQTLRLYSSALPRWNFNWIEFVSGTSSSSATKAAASEASSTVKSLDIFPNPVSDNFVLQVNNSNTGTMVIQIVDMKGTVIKELQSDKKDQSTQVYLSANGLSAGTYFINVRIGDWSQSIQMVKL
jgi:hypothetical protein